MSFRLALTLPTVACEVVVSARLPAPYRLSGRSGQDERTCFQRVIFPGQFPDLFQLTYGDVFSPVILRMNGDCKGIKGNGKLVPDAAFVTSCHLFGQDRSKRC